MASLETIHSAMLDQSHPDLGRQGAFKVWLSRLSAAQTAIIALQDASSNPLLTQQTSDPYVGLNGLSFEKLCLRIDNRASDLQRLLAGVQRVAASVGKIRNASNLLISLHRLPNELLRRVFNYSIFVEPNDSRTLNKFILKNLIGVCSFWRQICTSTPQYWGRIDFAEGYPFERTRFRVERTQGSCLEIVANFFSPKPPSMSALELVLPSIARWSSFILIGPDHRVKEIISALTMSDETKALKRLSIEGRKVDWVGEASFYAEVNSFWETFPNLNDVVISFARMPWRLPILRNLTRLVLSYVQAPSQVDFKAVFANCPNLRWISLDNVAFEDGVVSEDPIASNIVEYACLEAISLTNVSSTLLRLFFSSASAPVLQFLKVDGVVEDAPNVFLEFLRRSSCDSLTSLTVTNYKQEDLEEDDESTLVDILANCQSLKKLHIYESVLHSSVLQSLAPMERNDWQCECPQLEELYLYSVNCSMFLVADVAEGRAECDDVDALIELNVDSCSPVEDEEHGMPFTDYRDMKRAVQATVGALTRWDWDFH